MKGWASTEFGDRETRIMGTRASRQERLLDGKLAGSQIFKRFKMLTMVCVMESAFGFRVRNFQLPH